MDPKDLEFEETLADSELLLKNTARSMDEDAEFSLESILAEYGSGTPAPEEAEEIEPQPVKKAPAAEAAPPQKKAEAAERHADSAVRSAVIPFPGMKTAEAPAPEDPAPQDGGEAQDDAPKAMSLQDILAQTVQEALAEREDTIIEEEPPRRGLFSRRKMRDTEQLYDDAEEEEEEEDAFDEAELDLPEPPLQETLADYRAQLSGAVKARRGAGVFTLALCVMALLEHFSLLPAAYVEDPMIRALPLLAAEAIVCAIGWRIFARAIRSLRQGRTTSGFLTMLLCLVTLTDTALYAFLPARAALSLPLPAVGALSVYCALLGESMRLHGMYDTFRIAAIGNAPYIVTVTAGGAAKRVGQIDGFSNFARSNDPYARWQNVLLPVFLTAAVVFGVLSTLEAKQNLLLAWNLSVLLASANLLAFPMVCALPLKRIAARLAKSGSAVAGFFGADAIRRSNCVILTDGDIFPPGTVTLGGLKTFGEESGKVISYAATMAYASESGLSRLFNNLLASDGGFRETVEDVDFYEEGGVGGRMHGELHAQARREPAAQFGAQDGHVPLCGRYARCGLCREVYARGECRLGAPRLAPQPHHAGARRARRQHHPRALEAQVRHRCARGLPQARDTPRPFRARRRTAVCPFDARGAHALCRSRARQQAPLSVRQKRNGACIFSRYGVYASRILFNFCRCIQRAHAAFAARLPTFMVSQRAR